MKSHPIMTFATTLLAVALAVPADAQSDLGFKGLGVTMGIVDPSELGSTFGLSGIIDLGTLAPRVTLDANLAYWSKTTDFFILEHSARDFAIGSTARYHFELEDSRLTPFAGVGLAFHFLKASLSNAEDEISNSETKLGLDFSGGFTFPLGLTTEMITELRYRAVSEVSQIGLAVGVLKSL